MPDPITISICSIVALCNMMVSVHAFKHGRDDWGWVNLIFSAANAALVLKEIV
jgi:hypothetical protein